jgi:hypothetical protein
MLLAVDTAGVAQSARRTQLRREHPATPCSDTQAPRIRRRCLQIEIVVPRQTDPPVSQRFRLRFIVVDLEDESCPSRFVLRQRNDSSGQFELTMLHRQGHLAMHRQ